MPFASADFSGAASTVQIAGAIVAAIGLFKSYWIGGAFAVAGWFVMSIIARGFNPSNFLADEYEWAAHHEILSFLQAKQRLQHFRANQGGRICARCGAAVSRDIELDSSFLFDCKSCGELSLAYDSGYEYLQICTSCRVRSVLDRSELRAGKFTCPNCGVPVLLNIGAVVARLKE
jgi:predicted RNA-binding Zn-ribbon protein involved in translation (DUF1610 family)